MRKKIYQALRERLKQLIITEDGEITFVKRDRLRELMEKENPPVWLRHFIFPNSMNTAGISKTFSSSMNSTCRFHSATCFIAYSGV